MTPDEERAFLLLVKGYRLDARDAAVLRRLADRKTALTLNPRTWAIRLRSHLPLALR